MGGKVWSDREEQVFWDTVVPQSPNAANPADRNLSWKECAALMQRTLGDDARRNYTPTMLYEHHYQNRKPGPNGAKANRFMRKYLRDCEWYETHSSPPPAIPSTLSKHSTASSAAGKVAIPRLGSSPAGGLQRRGSPMERQSASPTYKTDTPAPSPSVSQRLLERQNEATEAAEQLLAFANSHRGPSYIDPTLRSGVVINHIFPSFEQEPGEPIPVFQYFVSNTGEMNSSPARSQTSTGSTNDSLATDYTQPVSGGSRSSTDLYSAGYGHARAAERNNSFMVAARPTGHDSGYSSITGKRKRSETETLEDGPPAIRTSAFMAGGRSLLNETEAPTTLQRPHEAAYKHPKEHSPPPSNRD